MTAHEFNSAGCTLLNQERFVEAVGSFQQALRLQPHNAEAHNNLGIAFWSLGKPEEAIASFMHALSLRPDFVDVYNNLGLALLKQHRFAEAGECYQRMVHFRPDDVEACNNLGIALRHQGKPNDAAACYQQVLRLQPDHAEAHNNLGVSFRDQGKRAEAMACFREAVRLKPDHARAHQNLASTLRDLGRTAEAAAAYEEALRLQPDNEEARFFLGLLNGVHTPDTAPTSYVKGLFDNYAEMFDEQLVEKLNYRAPQLLRAAVADLSPDQALAVLDLGCGTGLCGLRFCDLARTLTGVDLSPAMLARARQRGIYHELLEGDVTAVLSSGQAEYDLIVAADVFIYVGNLVRVFAGVRRALRPAGRFAFTVEVHEGEDYAARPSGRFAHSLAYLRGLAAENGLVERSVQKAVLRKELSGEIEGYVLVFQLGRASSGHGPL